MAPQRTRTTIGFEQRPSQGALDGSLPRLTLFEHVSGARVLADLFPYYRLPNGKKAYYYYDAGQSSELWFEALPNATAMLPVVLPERSRLCQYCCMLVRETVPVILYLAACSFKYRCCASQHVCCTFCTHVLH